jgi:26S proteasome regulatory subunit N11
MERLQRYLSNIGGAGGGGPAMSDTPMVDTSEQVYISSLALLKMLKHGACAIGLALLAVRMLAMRMTRARARSARWSRFAGAS